MTLTGCGARVSLARTRAGAGLDQSALVAVSGAPVAGGGAVPPVSGSSAAGGGTAVTSSGAVTTAAPGQSSVPVTGAGQPVSGGQVITAPTVGPSAIGNAHGKQSTPTVSGAGKGASTKPAAGKSAEATATAASGPAAPISVGVVGTFSGVVGEAIGDTATAIQIWAKYVNARGGVDGHQVNVLVGDDGGDPAKFNSLAQQFVTQDHAIAFIFTSLGLAPGGNNSYLDGQHIATFGTEGGLDESYTDQYLPTPIPTGHAYADSIMYAVSKDTVPEGKTKMASFACSDFSLCDNFDAEWSNAAMLQATGYTNVYRARPSLTQPDFTSDCLQAEQAGAQVILLGMDTASIQRIGDDCARQNYHPILGVADLLAFPSLPQDANVDGAVVGTKIAPFAATSVPGIAQMDQAYAQYAPSQNPANGSAVAGWTFAQFFAAAAANLPANPTAADVITGLHKIKGNDLDGLTYPLDFTQGLVSPKHVCWGNMIIKNKAYSLGPGPALQCAS